MDDRGSDENGNKNCPDVTDVHDCYSDESEREHSDDTDVDTDLGKTEREEPDVKESNLGDKDQYENKDSDHHITIIPRNDPRNSYKIRSIASYYLRKHNRNRPYLNVA